jgi:hypothetical protein
MCGGMRRLPLLAVAGLVLTGCADRSVTRVPGHAVAITIADYRYVPQNVSVAAGQVFFAVKNDGAEPTNLEIHHHGGSEVGRIYTMAPGAFKTLILRLKPGRYDMVSSVGKQAVLGQYGTLTVRPAAGGG